MSFFRKIFGPSKEEVWRQFCDEIGGDFIVGGFWRGSDKVQVKYQEWTITLDTYIVNNSNGESSTSTTYTRIRAPYISRDGFRFKIYRKNILSNIWKLFGMEDLNVGDSEFDRDFIIHGNNKFQAEQLFSNTQIRTLIKAQPHINIIVKDDEGFFGTKFPPEVDELYFEVGYAIKDVQQLKSLFELFAEILHELCYIGSAYKNDPKVIL
ncbi:hypothetical protein A6S26_32630 [Nostoc sp. ATCC 43529]|nr:hypothetical protein A6S26_32630 [Nostoc sp. ATCC 43529]